MVDNEITVTPKVNTLAKAQTNFMTNVLGDLKKMQCTASDYGKLCGINILGEINHLLVKESLDLYDPTVDQTSIFAAVQFAMMSELNTTNKEIFVQIRNEERIVDKHYDEEKGKTVGYKKWFKIIECKPQYRGQIKIINKFGEKVKKVYPMWVVREGDDFTFPTFNGITKTPPTWVQKGTTGKVVRVVVPVEFSVEKGEERDIQFFIADRDSVATNIKAQINQSLMHNNNRERLIALIKDMNLEELLECKEVASYINNTYTGISKEEMFITKLFLNATKRIIIDYGNAYVRELAEKTYDNSDVYTPTHTAREIVEELGGVSDVQEIKEQPIKEISQSPNKTTPVADDNGEVKGLTPEEFTNQYKKEHGETSTHVDPPEEVVVDDDELPFH